MSLKVHPEVVAYFKRNPEIYRAKKNFINASPYKIDETLKRISIVIDDIPRAIIEVGQPLKVIQRIPDDFETYEITFDEESVLFIVGTHLVINRLAEEDRRYFEQIPVPVLEG